MSGSWVGLFEPALSILEAQLAPNREA
jgi:hypothetical protein